MVKKIGCSLLMMMLVCSAVRMSEEEEERAFTQPYIFPVKVIRAEWHKSFPLVENMKSKLQRPK